MLNVMPNSEEEESIMEIKDIYRKVKELVKDKNITFVFPKAINTNAPFNPTIPKENGVVVIDYLGLINKGPV